MPFKADKRLYNLAMKLNRELFDSSLPQDLIVGWEDELDGCGHYGATIALEDDLTKTKTFRVSINASLKGIREMSHSTLIHELAHVKLYPYMKHGRRFEEEMVRLAVRGAFKGIW